MLNRFFTTAILAILSAPAAHAEWRVTSHKDRLTDKRESVATLTAIQADHGVAARLRIHCLAADTAGGLVLAIETTATFTRGRMGLRFRIDEGAAQNRYMPVAANGDGMSQWADPEDLRGARRLRVQLEPARSPNLFYEFDLSGVDKALDSIPCVKT